MKIETVRGSRLVGPGHPAYVVAEVGINHNGDPGIARALIDVAAHAGCDAVKLQKRDVDATWDPEFLASYCEHPFGGPATMRRQKEARELPWEVHSELAAYAAERGLDYSLSCWDPGTVRAAQAYLPGLPWLKVASCHVANRDHGVVSACVETGLPLIASTGACAWDDVDWLVAAVGHRQLALLHCVSTYPAKAEDLNLSAIVTLRRHFGLPIGYSGHETGIALSVCAVALGACIVERHITLDRSMYGNDQAASLEPDGLRRLVRDIRAFELAQGDGVKRRIDAEHAVMKKLRRVGT